LEAKTAAQRPSWREGGRGWIWSRSDVERHQ
jgi:hypothetical protein